MRELALELLEFVDDVVDELGSRREIEYVHTILSGRHQRRTPAAGVSRDRRPARGRAVARRETRESVERRSSERAYHSDGR